MKIAMLTPRSEFTQEFLDRLEQLGEIVFTDSRREYPIKELTELCQGATIIGLDPDNLGGFEKAPITFVPFLEALPMVKGIALVTTSYGYIDIEYCKNKGIIVTNVPYYATESVAEHALAFLLGCAKRIFISDRCTQSGIFKLIPGFELRGKTLGVIGLGHIGTRIAELGNAIGMKVLGWNRTHKEIPFVDIYPLDKVLSETDAIVISLADKEDTKYFISTAEIDKMKTGTIIVNIASRSIVDEKAMAVALQNGKVDSYVVEGDDLTSPPLGSIEQAFLFRQFGWYTKEALDNNYKLWIDNIESIIKNRPENPIF